MGTSKRVITKYKKKESIYDKSFQFAIDIIKLTKKIKEEQKEYIMSKQLMRSATSVGANIREANNAESKADFIHKLSISQKEADESIYWIELLYATNYINKEEFDSTNTKAVELIKIIKAIIISTKNNLAKNKTSKKH
jgi:four helix bundle protein